MIRRLIRWYISRDDLRTIQRSPEIPEELSRELGGAPGAWVLIADACASLIPIHEPGREEQGMSLRSLWDRDALLSGPEILDGLAAGLRGDVTLTLQPEEGVGADLRRLAALRVDGRRPHRVIELRIEAGEDAEGVAWAVVSPYVGGRMQVIQIAPGDDDPVDIRLRADLLGPLIDGWASVRIDYRDATSMVLVTCGESEEDIAVVHMVAPATGAPR